MGLLKRNREQSQRLVQASKDLSKQQMKVGFFATAKYPDGTPVAYVAAIQEFGYAKGNIPPRPFMRPAATAHGNEWSAALGQGCKAIATRGFSATAVMGQVGMLAAADIQKSIDSVTSPPLRPETIAHRLSRYADKKTVGNLTKPLEDTGLMRASVTYEMGDQ